MASSLGARDTPRRKILAILEAILYSDSLDMSTFLWLTV
jgi:hypothetical protein